MASGRLIDYLGVGLASARPAAPSLYTGTLGLWFSTDTGILSAYDGAAWEDIGFASMPSTGGWQDGDLLRYDAAAAAFVAIPAGAPGDVLTMESGQVAGWQAAGAVAVASVNGQTGVVVLSLEDLTDVLPATGTPSDGEVLTWSASDGAWVASPPVGGGDVNGPMYANANSVPRWDDTTGTLLTDSGVQIEDDDALHGYRGKVETQTGTTYTFGVTDTGKIIEFSNGSAITVTLPTDLPVGFAVTCVQAGAGQVTFSTAGNLRNRQTQSKTAGQWAMVTLYVRAAGEWVLGGDTGA